MRRRRSARGTRNSLMEQKKKVLEQQITQILENEKQAIPADQQFLIPTNFTPEDQLEWILRAKQSGVFSGVFTSSPLNLSSLPETFDSRYQKMRALIKLFLRNEFERLPEDVRELIPEGLTTAEKFEWLQNLRQGGIGDMPSYSSYSSNGGPGTGPNTGPGTAPGTGPGTAPWLES
ncbi:hypothetical protein [Bacillus massiliglaciei]|uniref:hypothetical protein n=1 Tax=Bacillus massiliglaciei TaxID=1816693 RepID=UPI000AC6C4BC|nr:hypothetical protein [Bacillus massiliglaciei]